MKRILLWIFLLSGFATSAQTTVNGTISVNTTWNLAGSPYTVSSNITVANGVTLTIEQDVVVKFDNNIGMVINGIVNATGATFTASSTSPTPGIISTIRTTGASASANFTNSQFLYFQSIMAEAGSTTFTNCTFSNFSSYGIESFNSANLTISGGSIATMGTSGDYAMLRLYDNSVNAVSNFTITGSDNSYEVIADEACELSLNNVTIQTSTGDALWLGTSGDITITDCDFNNTRYPIHLGRSGVPVTFAGTNGFTNNTYDAVYCPFNQITVNTTLNNPGIPYWFTQTLQVLNTRTLTIAPASILKMSPSTSIDVYGTLDAQGTTTDRIYFTSLYDDNLGGDSNNDANNTSGTGGKWYGVHFYNESNDASVLSYSDVRFVGSYGGVNLTNASPDIDNCNFSTCYYGAVFSEDSNPGFSNNSIADSDYTPIAMSFEADPVFSNNEFSSSDNEYDAIGLLGGTLTADATIIKRDFTDLPNVTYVMLNNITVPSTRTLTIEAGVVIKNLHGYKFYINGTLLVNGTASEKVVFTSVNDDNFGNPLDTRNDGTSQLPAIGQAGGFYFSETASSTSVINNASIRFASFNEYYTNTIRSYAYSGAIAIFNSSPTISNSEIFQATNGIDIRGIASPVISNNSIVNTAQAPIRLAIQSTPVISGNTFTSVGWKAIGILPEVINYTATLSPRNIDGLFDNVTYVISDLYINTGAQVTFDAGLVIKLVEYSGIVVEGGFKVAGTADARVLFTSIADDNAGASLNPVDNDTQGNGNATVPADRPFNSISFEPSSNDAFSSIAYADFHFGGYYGYSPLIWNSASAPISNVNIRYSEHYGLYFSGNSAPLVDNVFIQSSYSDPIAMSFFSNPTFTNITFDANGSNGLRLIDTEVGANATLYKRDVAGITNIAYVSNGFLVHSGAELTINPGVVLKMTGGSIGVGDGKISAIGTTSEKIIFTSIYDDSRGGDTNNNGNATPPAAGNWGGIDTRASSKQTIFRHCEFRYGSMGHYHRYYGDNTGYSGMIRSDDNNMIVENCVVQFTNNTAFGAYGTSTASFINNVIQNVAYEPLVMNMFANPTLSGNTLENVGIHAILLRPETFSQNATFVFRNFGGYDSITYTIGHPGFTIATGTTITVPAGMHFKSDGTVITVNGNLQIAGTSTNPVVFTSMSDDEYGRPKDTHQNGIGPVYRYANPFIVFNNISDDNSKVDFAIFRHAYGDIHINSASPTITNTVFELSQIGIGMSGISEPVIDNNTFRNLDLTPFTTSLVSYPASTSGNTMEGTTWKAVWINDETLTQDTTLVKRSFGGINNIPYVMSNYSVGPGVKLTIKPGVIVKFARMVYYPYQNGALAISGALEALGGPDTDSTIVFTAIEDDFYGGDTNSNGPPTSPYGSFRGLFFNNESSDALSKLDHVIIKASSWDALTLYSASPTISNSSFHSNYQSGIYMTGASNPTLTNNDFIDNAYGSGISNTGSFVVNATGSWWGHNSGPYHATLNPEGKGDAVSDNVTFDPWATDLSLNPITGDVSLNGMISAYDASLALQAVVSLVTLNDRQEIAGDVSGDNSISAMDASYILQYSAGLINSFPAESTNKRKASSGLRESELRVSLPDAEINAMEDVIAIPLSLSDVSKLYAMELNIKIDDELAFVSFEPTGAINVITNYSLSEKMLKLAFAATTPATEDAIAGILKVKAATQVFSKPTLSIDFSRAIGNETDVLTLAKSARIALSPSLIEETNTAFKVFPNPAADFVNLTLKPSYEGPVDVTMTDRTGKVITTSSFMKERGFNSQKIVFKAEKGLYMLRIKTNEGLITSKILVGL